MFLGASSSASSSRPSPSISTKPNPWEVTKQQRRDKGLCFRCGEPFLPGHCCTSSSFSLIEVNTDGNPIPKELEPVPKSEEVPKEAKISFNTILGRSSTAIMKLCGSIRNREVLLLVDSGSTHNFISESLVRELNLPTLSIPTLGVQIGDGSVVRCNQLCKEIRVQLPGLNITQDFYPFSLVGSDLVLGIQWLVGVSKIPATRPSARSP